VCALVLATGLTVPTAGQIQIMPAGGDGPIQFPGGREMKTGTGRIKGRLVSAETGTPIRRAQVRLA